MKVLLQGDPGLVVVELQVEAEILHGQARCLTREERRAANGWKGHLNS